MQTLTETLLARVERHVPPKQEPLLSTAPHSVAIAHLLTRVEALEEALRDMALELPAGEATRSRLL